MTDYKPAVLGIDPSQTRAGVAIIAGGPKHINWPFMLRDVGETGHNSDSWAQRSRRIVAQVRAITYLVADAQTNHGLDIRLAVIEGPAYGADFGNQFDRAAVWWGVFSALTAKQIPIGVVMPTTRSKFATGHGRAPKQTVLTEMRQLWAIRHPPIPIANHDQADALALATMGVMHLGWSLPFPGPPRRRHVENVATVNWPECVATP